ncbi:hypothetical protein ACFX1X_027381 [Malus domestica]
MESFELRAYADHSGLLKIENGDVGAVALANVHKFWQRLVTSVRIRNERMAAALCEVTQRHVRKMKSVMRTTMGVLWDRRTEAWNWRREKREERREGRGKG